MTTTAIILFLLGLVAGGAAGWFFSRRQAATHEKARVAALELTLADCRREMEQYRADVSRHFETTAGLFTDVTTAYRELHHHLADGYEKLTGAPKGKMLLEGESGAGLRAGRMAATAAIAGPLAYGADTPLDETAGDEGDLDEAARRELDFDASGDEGLPETVGRVEPDEDEFRRTEGRAEEDIVETAEPLQFARTGELDEEAELDDPVEFGETSSTRTPEDEVQKPPA